MKRLRRHLFSLAFGLTGVGTALLGAALPATLQEWHLSDSGGGTLLFAAWGGATVGALFVRGVSGASSVVGLALAAAGMFLLTVAHAPVLPLLYLLYGIGLGLTMTSISLMRSREVSRSDADIELNRLNLIWAVGALLAPALALYSLHALSVAGLFRVVGTALALVAVLLALADRGAADGATAQMGVAPEPNRSLPWAPLRYGLFAAAAVGLESAIGSWLTTYTERLSHGVGTAVSANSAFWAGLLISRAAHSLRSVGWAHTRAARIAHISVVGISAMLLILVPAGPWAALAGLLAGVGLGPLYPYVLSIALPRFRSNGVFVLAGIGASVVPWATGAVSTASGSLRIGLLVPCGTFLLLGAAAIRLRSELGSA